MYKKFTATELKRHLSLPDTYGVDGFLVYGTFRKYPYELLKERLAALGKEVQYNSLADFLEPVLEFNFNNKRYWFVVAYGGTLLSEWLHLACLFGSRANIALGSCGGLFEKAESGDIIVPTYSYGDESPTRAYAPDANNKHFASEKLSKSLVRRLEGKHEVLGGPIITYQAMLAETWEDVQKWSREGYYGVEMEAATVFAVSNSFGVPAASAVVVGDNLIKEETVLDVNYEKGRDLRRKVTADLFDAAIEELASI